MIIQERLKEIKKKSLEVGKHKNFKEGACVMECVAYITGDKWTDHPECACPILTRYAIRLNDIMNEKFRQKLKPLIPMLAESKNEEKVKARYEHLAISAITVFLPLLTDALDLKKISKKLRSFKIGEWKEARKYIDEVRPEIRDAAAYADAAADAAAYAADAAAAYAAAYAAAAYAAYAAADAAAYAADAADAAAAAAAAAYAAAYAAAAADAAAGDKKKSAKWTKVKESIWQAGIDALEEACKK